MTVSVLNMASSTSHVRNDSSHAPWMSVLNTTLHAITVLRIRVAVLVLIVVLVVVVVIVVIVVVVVVMMMVVVLVVIVVVVVVVEVVPSRNIMAVVTTVTVHSKARNL